jgi:hypothetical protein
VFVREVEEAGQAATRQDIQALSEQIADLQKGIGSLRRAVAKT